MVKERMDLLELLRKGGMDGDVDFLREALRVLVEGIMDAEVSSRIGAEYGERSPERVTQRNGYRSRAWDTRVGTMETSRSSRGELLPEPAGATASQLSELCWRSFSRPTWKVYPQGGWIKALGCEGISKSQVSRICQTGRGGGWLPGPSAGRCTLTCGWTH